MKKWLALALATIMVLGLMGSVAVAGDEYPAAPSIAAELLRDAGVEQLGPSVSAVARETRGREAEFQGLKKSDDGYREAVRDFLVLRGAVRFSPSHVPGMVLWLDGSSFIGEEEETPVTNWLDVSGKGYHAFQDTEAMQPVIAFPFKDTDSQTDYSLPAVRFDGNNDRLEVPYIEALDNIDGFQVFAVVIPNLSGNNYQRIVDKRAIGSGSRGFAFYIVNNGRLGAVIQTEGDGAGTGDWAGGQFDQTVTAGQPYLAMLSWNAFDEQANIYLDGEAGTPVERTGETISTSGLPLLIGDRAGGDRSLNGYIAEIIIYNRALNETDRSAIDNYLIAKYGL